MKKFYFSLLTLFLFSYLGFSQTNHLTNGSFENWDNLNDIPVGWQIDTRVEREQFADPIDGQSSLKLSSSDLNLINLSVALSDWFVLEAETTYTLSYSFKVINGEVENLSGTAYPKNGIDYGSRITRNIENDAWITIKQQFTARTSTDHFIDIIFKKNSSETQILIDDVRVESGIPVHPDREALVALHKSTNGDFWTFPWDYHRDISLFPFSEFNDQGRLTKLFLYDGNLNGTLPIEIGNLTELKRLEIRENPNLRGQIPAEIGNLTKLSSLDFSGCDLSGGIPGSIGFITGLKSLRLAGNRLNTIPSQMENLSLLETLDLSENRFSGGFPSFFTALTELNYLNLSYFNFEFSPFPNEIFLLQKLEYLNLKNSSINDEIPSQLWNMPLLTEIDLSNNILTGRLPSSFGNTIQIIDLSQNFVGPDLPENMESSFSLEKLNLSSCGLGGLIPESFGNFAFLSELNLSNNDLSGDIPFFNNSDITLNVSNNRFVFENLTNSIADGNRIDFSNQKSIGFRETVSLTEGENFSATVISTIHPNNSFLWLKNGVVIEPNQTESTLLIENVGQDDLGAYSCYITNDSVLGLTLVKEPTILEITTADNDNDGITNDLDTCPDTPSHETANSNGCSQSQLDDDNDGIGNDLDTCPDTPPNETANSNGCSQSQLDDDNDGISNDLDTCTNTPSNETVNENGCAASELDDDNDGVKNNIDVCPDTPLGEIANSTGCSQSQLDDDSDGITNDEDNCPDTPTGEIVDMTGCSQDETNNDDDADGIINMIDSCPNSPRGEVVNGNGCSQSQSDSDNDGVNDNQDNCPDTPNGETVNANGCPNEKTEDADIAPGDITVRTTSVSCVGSSNGQISLAFKKEYSYEVSIQNNGIEQNSHKINSVSGFVLSDLSSGTYVVCVSIPEFPNFEQCFSANIETPEDFKSGKVLVNDKKGKIIVSGSKNYELAVNDKKLTYNFEDTGNHELTFDLNEGANFIIATTDKACQGKFAETVLINTVRFFPNPSSETVQILGLKNSTDANITVSDMGGAILKNYVKEIKNSSISLSIKDLTSGIYIVRIRSKEQDIHTKVIKK